MGLKGFLGWGKRCFAGFPRLHGVLSALSFLFILHTSYSIPSALAQNVGISIAIPDNSALLQLESTTQGFLVPRMSGAQMLLIPTPASGDMVYNTTASTFYYFNGTIWLPVAGGLNWSLTGNSGTSASTNFLGTKDSVDLVQKTDNNERMRVFAAGNVGLTNVTNSAEALRFYEPSGSGTLFTGFKAGIQSGNVHYILPPSDGTPNQCLVTDGAGNLSWHTFATFNSGAGIPLWARGNGTYAEYSLGSGDVSGGKYSLAGDTNCSSSGAESVCWGMNNESKGSQSAVLGGANNSASSSASTIRGGNGNQDKGNGGNYLGGGLNNSVSGQNATDLGGDSNSSSGAYALIINGDDNQTASQNDLIFGHSNSPTGPNQLIFNGPSSTMTRIGINTTSPAEAADIVGNLRFSGGLSPNGSMGTSGQYLTSAGSGVHPNWGSIVVPATSWRLTGNIGTNSSINFIGTTDATAFVMRTNATEAMRIQSTGQVSINTTTSAHQLQSFLTGTSDETAAIYGNASGSTSVQAIGVWGRANTSSSNTGTISVLATGSGNTSSGSTNVALQLNSGEFAMGRDTLPPSVGTVVEGAASGTLYSQHGPSGVIQEQLSDLSSTTPVTGVYLDLGDVTINNEYIASTSIILAGVVAKINNSGTNPDPNNGIYKVDVESRTTGSCVIHIGMIPTVTGSNGFHTQCFIRIGYIVINPGR